MNAFMIYLPIVMAIIGLLFMAVKRAWVLKQDAGDGKMKEISDYIYEGALAFLKAEYRLLTFFVIGASAVLAGISFIRLDENIKPFRPTLAKQLETFPTMLTSHSTI